MKVSRWIYVPLKAGVLGAILYTLLGFAESLSQFASLFVLWSIFGFVMQAYTHYKAKRKTGVDDEAIHSVRQKKNVTVLLNFEQTFELCLDALESLKIAKIRIEDLEKGILEVRTGMNWDTFGVIIRLELSRINEDLTEVEISARPFQKGVLLDSGESWKQTEQIINFIKKKDAEINRKVLTQSARVLDEVYVKPFRKEKTEIRK